MTSKVTVYGAGYVGLVTGACLAELGHDVLIMDIDEQKIRTLNQGDSPIYEPGLEDYLSRNRKARRLHFTSDAKQAVQHGLFQIIAVGTPSNEDGSADLQYVLNVASAIGEYMQNYLIVVNKSTVAIGTANHVKQIIKQHLQSRQIDIEYDVVSNPEFLKQGEAINDFMNPNRIIIGVENDHSLKNIIQLYAKLTDNGQNLIVMDPISAEFTKYVANAYLAMRISFMNDMSMLAEKLGADIDSVRKGIGSDQRIGKHFLYAGCGFGGSCFPKDVRALQRTGQVKGYQSPFLNAIERVNLEQKRVLFQKIYHYLSGNLRNKAIAIWGLAFKPNTDDMREAPSLVLIDQLIAEGAKVQVYDPIAIPTARRIYGHHKQIEFFDSAEAALNEAEILAIVTEWDEFRNPAFDIMRQKLRLPAIFDGRNLYDPELVEGYGIAYFGIGRGRPLSDFGPVAFNRSAETHNHPVELLAEVQ